MKANVEFSKKAKNSLIYFQVGLIATMVVVLLLLEFNFMSKEKEVVVYTPTEPTFKEEYIYTPVVIKTPVQETKTTKVVKPMVKLPKDPVVLKVERDNVAIPKEELATETSSETDTASTTETGTNESEPTTTPIVTTYSSFNIEQLPMFKACKGLSKSEQKACFDEQLAKVVSKHLVYPKSDLENRRQGLALIEFVINEKGEISDIKAVPNGRATPEMELAAKKAISKVPKLEPAKQGNNAVRLKYSLPIKFKLNEIN